MQLLTVMHGVRHVLSVPHTSPPAQGWVEEQDASSGNSHTPLPLISTQSSPEGQASEAVQAS